ncbi:MAG: TPM domain-containing protein [Eubacteriales bacterium]|nr:TPM domain-containing protein [Eubacteriales bacterium]
MKKRFGIFTVFALIFLCLLTIAPVGVSASDRENIRVFDEYGLLDETQEAELNEELAEIRDTYQFDAVIVITEDISGDERQAAARFMQEYGIGYGEEKNGMCIYHQPGKRNIAVVFRGEAQYAFDTKIQDMLLDDCTEKLKADDPMGAYQITLRDLKNGLERFAQGKKVRPMDVSGDGIVGFALIWLLISLAVTAVPVLLMVLYQKSRMKTAVAQRNADFYIPSDGFRLDMERDIYVRTATTRRKIEKSDNSGPGGSSGSFSSGGESFSGSSRNY